jgi:hypothetical protein
MVEAEREGWGGLLVMAAISCMTVIIIYIVIFCSRGTLLNTGADCTVDSDDIADTTMLC